MSAGPQLRSHADAEKHFFRNLNNTRELRHNPIVSHVFERISAGSSSDAYSKIAAEIRAVVSDAADRLLNDPTLTALRAGRQREIIHRCDVQGIAHKEVADSLGLCDRQFYRERAVATRLVAAEVRRWASRAIHRQAPRVDVFALELNRVDALRQMACFDDAQNLLDSLIARAAGGTQRAHALVCAAGLAADLGNFDDAQGLLDDARRCVDADSQASEASRLHAYAEISLASALLADAQSDIVRMETLSQDVIGFSRRAYGAGAGNDVRALEARGMLLHSLVLDVRGVGDARELLRGARELIEAADYPVAATAEYFRRALDHYISRCSDEATVVEAYARAIGFANQHGLMVASARIIALYGSYLYRRGEVDLARNQVRASLEMKPLEKAHVYSELLMAAANFECSPEADPRAGVALALRARAALTPGSYYWASTCFIEARNRLILGDAEGAIPAISQALDAFRNLGSFRLQGASMRVLAEAHHAAGRAREAASTIGQAIEHLRVLATSRELYLAYEASASITGSREHAREARRLKRDLAAAV